MFNQNINEFQYDGSDNIIPILMELTSAEPHEWDIAEAQLFVENIFNEIGMDSSEQLFTSYTVADVMADNNIDWVADAPIVDSITMPVMMHIPGMCTMGAMCLQMAHENCERSMDELIHASDVALSVGVRLVNRITYFADSIAEIISQCQLPSEVARQLIYFYVGHERRHAVQEPMNSEDARAYADMLSNIEVAAGQHDSFDIERDANHHGWQFMLANM